MKPEMLLVKAIYVPAIAALERDFTLHKLWTVPDPDAYVRQACGNVRAAVTTTTTGFSRRGPTRWYPAGRGLTPR